MFSLVDTAERVNGIDIGIRASLMDNGEWILPHVTVLVDVDSWETSVDLIIVRECFDNIEALRRDRTWLN